MQIFSSGGGVVGTQFVSLFVLYMSLTQGIFVLCNWVDPDTESQYQSTKPLTNGDEREFKLVFSDEFETDGRSFEDGEDSKWTALDKNDYTNDALHFYKSANVKTSNGVMNISTTLEDNEYKAFHEKTKKFYVDTKHVQSAMVQGWNKFCLTGGIVEYSAKLPGSADVGGLWPALWLLGNLARATYVGSSNWMWPFSYDVCDPKRIHEQDINACRKIEHYGMKKGVGRGAPEIDILEVMGGEKGKLPNTPIQRPYFSSSFQVAPGVDKNRPNLMHQPKPGSWYEGLEYGDPNTTSLNPFFYGVTLVHTPREFTYQSDAISANTQINETFFGDFIKYRVEWEPPSGGNHGYIKWFVNDKFLFGINGHSLNITGSKIPDEPMYLIMNTAVASSWGFPTPCPEGCDCKCFECGNPDCSCGLPDGYCDNFPANFEIEYVRVYQALNDTNHQLGCSTEQRPTTQYIKGHQERYMEKDDRAPLLPLRIGGGQCASDFTCGGTKHGECVKGLCICKKGYAGSLCLSHYGFDDDIFEEYIHAMTVSSVYLPGGFVVILSIIAIGFLLTFGAVVRNKRRSDIEFLSGEKTPLSASPQNDPSQQSQSSYYYEPTTPSRDYTKSTVTSYYKIDGRLLDSD